MAALRWRVLPLSTRALLYSPDAGPSQVASRYGRVLHPLSDLHVGCGQPPLSGLGTLEWLE